VAPGLCRGTVDDILGYLRATLCHLRAIFGHHRHLAEFLWSKENPRSVVPESGVPANPLASAGFLEGFGDHFGAHFGVIFGSNFGYLLDYFLDQFWDHFGDHFGSRSAPRRAKMRSRASSELQSHENLPFRNLAFSLDRSIKITS